MLLSFKYEGWTILKVSGQKMEDAYLFYAEDPAKSKYVNLWAGVALIDEEDDIYKWVLQNVPRIPKVLARCFAWHVTKGRDLNL